LDKNINALDKLFAEIDEQNKNNNAADISSLSQKYRALNKSYSVSALDTYISCPYRFFAEKILRQSAEDTLERGLSPAESGSLLHKILYVFYTNLQKNDIYSQSLSIQAKDEKYPAIKTVSLDRSKKTEYLELLKKIAIEEFTSYSIDNPFIDYEKTKLLGGDSQGILEYWLDNEIEYQKTDEFRPALFEMTFGGKTKASLPAIEVGGLNFRGKIDRVELSNYSKSEIEFRIADYKSSTAGVSKKGKIETAEALQLSVYMLAMEKLFDECYDFKPSPAGGLYYVMKPVYDKKNDSGKSFAEYNLTEETAKSKSFSETVYKQIEAIKAEIEFGKFDYTPSNTACLYCKMSNLCRKDELKETFPRN
jgi:ATP-dependent helicase/nuclease subunit B